MFGIFLGRKNLIDAALANNNPWEGAVCRAMKVAKKRLSHTCRAVLPVAGRHGHLRCDRVRAGLGGRLLRTLV